MEDFIIPPTPQGSEAEFFETPEAVNILEIASIHVCGHWTVTIPASGNVAEWIVPIDDEFADFEVEGAFIYKHVFSPTPCPAAECQAIHPLEFQRIDDEWISDWEGWLAHELPHYEPRARAANLLVTCNQVWIMVEQFSPDAQKYFAKRLESRDKFVADIIARGDLENGPDAMARNALRAETWLDTAADWWDEGRKPFYTACLIMAENHLNHQEFALEGFLAALEETQIWLRLPMVDDFRELPDNDSDSDFGLGTLHIADGHWGAEIYDMNLTDFFHANRNALKVDAEPDDTYAPSSTSEYSTEYNDDDAVSDKSITVDEVVNLYRDQTMYGPAYTPWIGRMEEVQLPPAVEHLVHEYLTNYGSSSEQDAFHKARTLYVDGLSTIEDQTNAMDVDGLSTVENQTDTLEDISSQSELDIIEPEDIYNAYCRYTLSVEQPQATKCIFGSGFQLIFGNGFLDDFEFHPSELL